MTSQIFCQDWLGYGHGNGYLNIVDSTIVLKLAEYQKEEYIIKNRSNDTLYCQAIDRDTGEIKYDQKLLIYGEIDSISIVRKSTSLSTTFIDSSHVAKKFTVNLGKRTVSTQFRFHEFQLDLLSPFGTLLKEIKLNKNGKLIEDGFYLWNKTIWQVKQKFFI